MSVPEKQRDIETNSSNSYLEVLISLIFNKVTIFKIFSIKAFFKS